MLSAATPNGAGAIGVSASEIAQLLTSLQAGFVNLGAGATITLTAAQMMAGFLLQSGGATSTVTTDTAVNILAALTQSSGASPRIGQTFVLDIANLNSGTTTLAGGTGVTLVGTTAIATTVERQYLGVVTGTPALGGAAIELIGMW